MSAYIQKLPVLSHITDLMSACGFLKEISHSIYKLAEFNKNTYIKNDCANYAIVFCYSNLKAWIGCSLDALFAGKTPKMTPTNKEKIKAIAVTGKEKAMVEFVIEP